MTITEAARQSIAVSYSEPEGIGPRGTLIVLTAPGETADAYARFGRRFSADAYRVTVIEADHEALTRDLIATGDLVAPIVIVGTDSAAQHAVEIAHEHGDSVAAVILAGIAVETGDDYQPELADEILARTACPNHQRILAETSSGPLFATRPALPQISATGIELTVPVLALHGNADRLSPLDSAIAEYRKFGVTEVHIVDGGLHDVLNDVSHRSVAATIVLFLERLRLARGLQPLVWAEHL